MTFFQNSSRLIFQHVKKSLTGKKRFFVRRNSQNKNVLEALKSIFQLIKDSLLQKDRCFLGEDNQHYTVASKMRKTCLLSVLGFIHPVFGTQTILMKYYVSSKFKILCIGVYRKHPEIKRVSQDINKFCDARCYLILGNNHRGSYCTASIETSNIPLVNVR